MIFADLDYDCSYDEAHAGLDQILRANFMVVESGHQGDSWFAVHDGAEPVAIDTFYSMRHQVKSTVPGPHVERVLEVLARYYRLQRRERPEPEPHE